MRENFRADNSQISKAGLNQNTASCSKAGVPLQEIFLFYALVVLSVFFVYIKPQYSLLFFGAVIAWSILSKKYYFWLAFFFLLVQAPGYLFQFSLSFSLPAIKLSSDIALSPIDLFTILMFLKLFFLQKKSSLNLKWPLMMLFAYFIFSFFRGAMFYSSSLSIPIALLRPLFYYSWIFIFVAFIGDRKNLIKFISLLLPITFFILFTQVYSLVSGREFIELFDTAFRSVKYNEVTGEVRAVVGGILLIFFNFIGASLLLKDKNISMRKKYLYLVLAASCISVFISATRIWFVLFLVVGSGIYFRRLKDFPKLLTISGVIFIIGLSLVKFGVFSLDYLQDSVWGRIAELSKFLSGEAGEIITFDERLGRLEIMWGYFTKEPIFGYGFSEFMVNNWLGHWGFFLTLYTLGLFGLGLFIIIFVKYFKMLIVKIKLTADESSRESLKVLLISFIGMLVLYASNWNFFSAIIKERIVFLMVFLGISEIFVGHPLRHKMGDRNGKISFDSDKG